MTDSSPIDIKDDSVKRDMITLKWGNLKAWDFKSDAALKVVDNAPPMPMSAMSRLNKEQVLWLIELIEVSNCETVHLDWGGVDVTKYEAVRYIKDANKEALPKGGNDE